MIFFGNIIFDNPLGDMYGPYFLIFYLFYIACVYLIGFLYKVKIMDRYNDSYINIGNLPEPDAYLITYIRAGVAETTKLVVYSLIERGYLQLSVHQKEMRQKSGHPSATNLTELENMIFNHIASSKRIEDIVDDPAMLNGTNEICRKMIAVKSYSEFIYSKEDEDKLDSITFKMRVALLVMGGYKLLAAFFSGHDNVFFLLILIVLSTIFAKNIMKPDRLTEAARKYIKELQKIYYSKYAQGLKHASASYRMLLLGIFGIEGLRDLNYDYLVQYEKTRNIKYSSDGSCGSASCSSGGGDGGSCGGGCGGCGGD